MNKVLVYTVIAILLGTATMVVPLAVLESNNPLVRSDDLINEIETTGAESQEQNGMLSATKDPAPAPEPDDYAQPDSETCDIPPEEPGEYTVSMEDEADLASSLSSIGLIVIPSFVIALGVFVLLKKRAF